MAFFKYDQDGYTVYPEEFTRTTTRRGVRTVCKVYQEGTIVAVLEDAPERIVAQVGWYTEAAKVRLLKKAKAAAKTGEIQVFGSSDDTYLSEYLRALTMAADEAWLGTK